QNDMWPIIFTKGNYHLIGVGNGGDAGTFSGTARTTFYCGAHVWSCVLFTRGAANSSFHHFSIQYAQGNGIWMGKSGINAGPPGIDISDNLITVNGRAIPIVFANDTIGVNGNNLALTQLTSGFPNIRYT